MSSLVGTQNRKGIKEYYVSKIDEKQITLRDKIDNIRRLQAQRNELNSRGKKNILK
jgi:26S proteasome regulatory subunit T6